MMSKHEHKECDHKLCYCDKCDVVYCLNCNKEWGGHKHWSYWWYPSTTVSTGTYKAEGNTSVSYDVTCDHTG
jgi:hypothetical protein